MNQTYQKLLDCYESVRARIPFIPRVALVLGSGLGNYADAIDVKGRSDIAKLKISLFRQYPDMRESLFSVM